MSDGFRCDGCDELYGGRPAAELSVTSEHSGIGQTLLAGHQAGSTDAHPGEKPAREVEWPFHRSSVQFCVDCFADHLSPAIIDATKGGRYGDD